MNMDWIKENIITIIIAVTNCVWTIYVYIKTTRLNGLKSLVLDHNIQYLYDFFSNIENKTNELKSLKDKKDEQTIKETKEQINESILQSSKLFEQKFIDLFLAVDNKTCQKLKEETDKLTDALTEAIFNDGINIYVDKIYDEYIAYHISIHKSKIISLLIENCK